SRPRSSSVVLPVEAAVYPAALSERADHIKQRACRSPSHNKHISIRWQGAAPLRAGHMEAVQDLASFSLSGCGCARRKCVDAIRGVEPRVRVGTVASRLAPPKSDDRDSQLELA